MNDEQRDTEVEMALRRYEYESPTGMVVRLEVPEPPMGDGSGWLPPPVVKFTGEEQEVEFLFRGAAE